jgi:DNA-binding GntR family transcriptional regulator
VQSGNGAERKPLTEDDCYNYFLDAIARGDLKPNQRLIETEIAAELGVGRATIRTALARLQQEGVVERERNRGARVRLISESEAVGILEARAVLECLAVRHAAVNATDDDVEALRHMLSEMATARDHGDLLAVSDLNGRLHQRLLKVAAHATVSRLLELLHSHHVRFQFRTILAPGRSGESFNEHTAIVNAIAAHDPDQAEAAMRIHLDHVMDALKRTRPHHDLLVPLASEAKRPE